MSERHRDCDLVVVSRRCLSQSTTEERGDQATNATAVASAGCASRVLSASPPVPSVLHTGGSPVVSPSPPSVLLSVFSISFSVQTPRGTKEGGREAAGRGGRAGNELAASGLVSLSPPPLAPVTKRAEPPSPLHNVYQSQKTGGGCGAGAEERRGEQPTERERRAL